MPINEEYDLLSGEEQTWEELISLDYMNVCRNSKADFDKSSNHYILPMFNVSIFISPTDRRIWGNSKLADFLLDRFAHYSRLSALWYLIKSKDIPLSNTIIPPREINGGLMFEKGSHILPLDKLAQKYGNNIEGFFQRSTAFGSEQLNYGDASVRLFPFPRIPVILIMWCNNEEFPSRSDLLFDTTCSRHLPTDILWSIAMLSILAMVDYESKQP